MKKIMVVNVTYAIGKRQLTPIPVRIILTAICTSLISNLAIAASDNTNIVASGQIYLCQSFVSGLKGSNKQLINKPEYLETNKNSSILLKGGFIK
ncbi:MAG: hypothetical protein V4440_13655, partial [Pseudomonadota bacterium]